MKRPLILFIVFASAAFGQNARNPPAISCNAANCTLPTGSTLSDAVPSMLPNWRLALAKARLGLAPAKLLCIGASITAGYGGTNAPLPFTQGGAAPNLDAFSRQLAGMLNLRFPASTGLAVPWSAAAPTVVDARWTYGTGWHTESGLGFGSSNAVGVSPSGSLTFTPGGGESFDSFDVYYVVSGNQRGLIAITATGGSTVNVDLSSTSTCLSAIVSGSCIGMSTATAASAATSNAVVITGSGSTYHEITAIEPRLSSAVNIVRVGNAGLADAQSVSWDFNYGTGYGSDSALAAYAPNLVIVGLDIGINNAVAGVSVATYKTQLIALIGAIRAAGADVVFFIPARTSTYGTYQDQYETMYLSVAQSYSIPIVDFYSRFLGANLVSSGPWSTDGVHPKSALSLDMAGAINQLLGKVQ